MIGFINTLYIHTTRDYRQYSAITILHTLQYTVTHALGFSVFTSHLMATDLSQSHCNFKSHMKSCHSLVPFLPLFCSCQFRRLDSIQSQAHIPAGWHVKARPFISDSTTLLLLLRTTWSHLLCPFITLGMDNTESTAFIVKEACLPVRYLAMDILLLNAYTSRECVHRVVA
jgi:hypothetical protein